MTLAPRILVLDRDEGLAAQVMEATEAMDPRPELRWCARVSEAAEVLVEAGPFDVLVAGQSMATRVGLSRLRVIHEELPATSLVLAFPKRPDAPLRQVVRAGAMDLVDPADPAQLGEAIQQAVDLRRALVAITATEAPVRTAGQRTHGTVFTVSSATGGCGKTFLATNLAWFLTHHTGKRVCLVDIDLQFGEVTTALRLRPRYTIFDALQRADDDDANLADHIEEYVASHSTGFSVLAAPRDPSEADHIGPADVTRIIDAVRSRYDYVVVDTPTALSEVVLAAFDQSDLLYTMATLDLPSVRNMGVFLGTLERLKIPSDNVRLLLNKAESDVGIEISQIAKLFPQGFRAIVPYSKEVSRSINVGMPVLAASPETQVSRILAAGLREVLPTELQSTIPEPNAGRGRRGLFRGMRRHEAAAPAPNALVGATAPGGGGS